MNYKEAMDYISRPYLKGGEYKLNTIKKILERLGNPQDKIKCIHIAGTNGKGSISAMTAKILEESGYKTGLYTSPYIINFEERIQINSQNIKKEDISRIITDLSIIIDEVIRDGFNEPSEFEIITCLMFCYFCEQQVDYAIIEVGLGGLRDCTNVINPILSAIASISFDHMDILGNSIEEIALQKAGIIKENVPTILYKQSDEVTKIIKRVCEQKNSTLTIADSDVSIYTEDELKNIFKITDTKNLGKQYFCIRTKKSIYDISLNLLGIHQIKNTNVVINIAENLIEQGLKINKKSILSALDKVKWIGRLEIMKQNPLVVLDGAHNIDGITNLQKSISKYFSYKKLILITGILKDKQIDDMVKILSNLADRIITVQVNNYRSSSSDYLTDSFKKYTDSVENINDYKTAYEKALSYANEDDLVLIAGSLYLIGDLRKICMTYQ